MITINRCVEFIQIAHKNQYDKKGVPYWQHAYSVFQRLPDHIPEWVKISALCHDVIEDTCYDSEILEFIGLTKEAIDIVNLVSRCDDSIPYLNWIKQIKNSHNHGAIIVKLADNFDNCSPNRFVGDTQEQSRIARYLQARQILREGLPDQFIPWYEYQNNNPY